MARVKDQRKKEKDCIGIKENGGNAKNWGNRALINQKSWEGYWKVRA